MFRDDTNKAKCSDCLATKGAECPSIQQIQILHFWKLKFFKGNEFSGSCSELPEEHRLIGRSSVLNERTGQFYKTDHCKVTRQSMTNPNGLRNIGDLALKQNMYR